MVRFAMRWRPARSVAMVAALAIGCGDPAARVRLVALGGPACRPMSANQVRVTSYGPSGEHTVALGLDEVVAIGSFAADTEQIGVEVLIGGGEIGAEGKSAPLAFGALADGAAIPVLMAPPDGFCELPAMTEARAQPVVAPAGDGALVVGGMGPSGPLSTAEYYDPTTASFVPVDVPPGLADPQGFTGTALATLPDGRVALIGGPQRVFVVFDPRVRRFVTDPTVIGPWAFHAAIATGDQEVLVAGGCMTAPPCAGPPQMPRAVRYELPHLTAPELSAMLPPALRIGARLFDLGEQGDGRRHWLLAGGTGTAGGAARFALDDPAAEVVPGGHAQTAALDGGAVLSVFGDDAAPPPGDGSASVFAPDAAAARTIAGAPARQGVRLIALEDGRVVGFGGAAMEVVTYDPTRDAWSSRRAMSSDQTGVLTAPSLVRLTDGTVLVVGGAVSARAWLYRPSLVGPASGSVTVVPVSDTGRGVLTASDPQTVTRVAGQLPAWLLTTPADAAMARALVGGPRIATGSVSAFARVLSGGVALIAQQTAPGHALVAELAPGSPPRLVRLAGGDAHELCAGTDAVAFDPATPVTLRLAVTARDARLSIGEREVLACSIAAGERGAWGIASLGAGARLAVDSVTVAR
ncbi:MAG: hypothetical protein E6J91_05260 [Deltaproteobacteria bacterium]|nr:MAG: hypothetical protein E6J91_05260 [Deltaproteobacteria bacterium]